LQQQIRCAGLENGVAVAGLREKSEGLQFELAACKMELEAESNNRT